MANITAWQAQLSFAERMNSTVKIAGAYQLAFPDTDATSARSEARKIETSAFQSSQSKDAYEEQLHSIILQYQNLANTPRKTTDTEITPTQLLPDLSGKPTITLGPYKNCTHHYTGLFSTIHLTPSPTHPTTLLAIKTTTPSTELPPHNSLQEAHLLSTLSHPNIIPLLTTHTLPTQKLLLTFPYLPLTLSTALTTKTPLPKKILHNIFTALSYIHSKEILHRDVKPTNILLHTPSGPAVLADFGIAWCPPPSTTTSTTSSPEPGNQKHTDVGTTSYRAPELLFGQRDYDTGPDLWAAGCVAAEIFVHNARCCIPSSPRNPSSSTANEPYTLFDPGPLGSDLSLIASQFRTLGTPTNTNTAATASWPDWDKMQFVQYPARSWEEILPEVGREEREVVGGLVRWEGGGRWGAGEVLRHAYFEGVGGGEEGG